jgi:acetylglutamate kinase
MYQVDSEIKKRAEILIQALPYAQKFRDKCVVVKYGGNAMINEGLKAAVIQDVVFMTSLGIKTILVHGGGPEIDLMLRALGIESRFVNGLRYTDNETMDVVQMVLCGKVNKEIAALVEASGGKALGICGIDGGLLRGVKLEAGEDLGLVGRITSVNCELLRFILNEGYIPVIATVALGTGDWDGQSGQSGQSLNVNADTAAAQIAAAMGAEKLIVMTDVQGIMRNVDKSDSLITSISRSELGGLIENGTVKSGMIPKVECCALALDGGVKTAHIIDGRVPHALLIELFTDQGIGTMIE